MSGDRFCKEYVPVADALYSKHLEAVIEKMAAIR